MLYRRLHIALLLICTVILFSCSKTAPIVDYHGSPVVTASGKKDLEPIKKAIVLGGIRAGWQMQPVTDGHIIATLIKEGRIAKVDIKYTKETYSITYKDSSNLLYNGDVIHGIYNTWVDNLHRQIRTELSLL